jgi:topoisomerase-4 subunit B
MAMAKSTAVYDESKVKTLSSLEHIRLRTGMYIGRLGDGGNLDDGIYILLKEIIDNSVDEYIMGHGNRIVVEIKNGKVKVRDFGRGIPLGKVIDCVSIINTGAKYNDDVFQFSVGLNGVGTKAVNALSSFFRVVSFREGKYFEAVFERGKIKTKKQGKAPKERDGSYIEFIPDEEIFEEYGFQADFVEQRLWNYAYLNKGLTLQYNGRKIESKNGLLDLLYAEVEDDTLYKIIYAGGERIEFSVDVREGIAGAISIKLKNPVFESQTKNKLGNTEIRGWIVNTVKEAVVDQLHRDKDIAKKLEEKIASNEKLRKELNVVKKEAREAAKKIALKIPNLKDCKYHLNNGTKGENTMIFVTEGQSATGSIVSSRDPHTQAIFSLRGKPLNVFGKNRTALYKNEELFNMMMALGIENDIDGLRYAKIILATDADHDGFHIRNLLLTFFLNYFEELVVAGRVYILETPLFRVRNKELTRYCYSARERNEALEKIKNAEVTRFKGLGEISPKEFGQFIGEDMRAVPVGVKSIKGIHETLDFYMGKNTPERREFIMENLV